MSEFAKACSDEDCTFVAQHKGRCLEHFTQAIVYRWWGMPRQVETPFFYSILDGCPVTRGHMLIVSKSSAASFLDLSLAEHEDLKRALDETVALIQTKHSPAGINIGMNCGSAAGQTVMHCHIHVIPRYHGDVPDPRGGVRNVIPQRGNYLLHGSYLP